MKKISTYFSKIITDETLEKILKLNTIKENINFESNAIYLKSFHYEDFECDCIDIYSALTDNLPQYQNILIYNKETVEEEIISFIYRFTKCNYNSLFTIIFKEKVYNKHKNNFLFENIKKNIKNNNKSILLILFSEKCQEIIFNYIKEFKALELPLKTKNISIDNISIIHSDICGAGKTEYNESVQVVYNSYQNINSLINS